VNAGLLERRGNAEKEGTVLHFEGRFGSGGDTSSLEEEVGIWEPSHERLAFPRGGGGGRTNIGLRGGRAGGASVFFKEGLPTILLLPRRSGLPRGGERGKKVSNKDEIEQRGGTRVPSVCWWGEQASEGPLIKRTTGSAVSGTEAWGKKRLGPFLEGFC